MEQMEQEMNKIMKRELEKRSNSNPLAVWDITIPEKEGGNKDKIIEILWIIAKKWAFQKEKGEETGYIHWQMRISLKSKMRKLALMELLHKNYWPTCHISITSEANKNVLFYATKEETRIEGPWTDKTELKNKKEPVIKEEFPTDVKMVERLWPWQEDIIKISKENMLNFRTINWIYDVTGAKGKTTLIRFCQAHKIGEKLMIGGGFKDMIRMAYDIESKKHVPIWFVDMPRAFIEQMGKKEKAGFISALEEIKGGNAYDDRYEFKSKIFDPPQVWVFSNWKPEENLLSKDRWKLWKLVGNMEKPEEIKLVRLTSFKELDEKTPKSVKLIINKITETKKEEIKIETETKTEEIIPIIRKKRR